MKLHAMVTLPGGGYICMDDEHDRPVGCIFWSKEQGKRILGAVEGHEDLPLFHGDIDSAKIDDLSDHPIKLIEGPAAKIMYDLFETAHDIDLKSEVDPEAFGKSMFYFTINRPIGKDIINIMGWRDPDGVDHISICHSKEQIRRVFKSCTWMKQEDMRKILAAVNSTKIRRKSRKTRLIITGSLVGYLSCAQRIEHMLEQQEKIQLATMRRSLRLPPPQNRNNHG